MALKLRRPGPSLDHDSGRRFVAEARRLARVRHDNVVAVHGADAHDGLVGLWTELVHGETLEERLTRDGPLGVHEAVAVGVDLCRALAAVHGAGLVHGDVKAANVIREHGGRIVLTDFGSGTDAGAEAATYCSPASVAPEVLQGSPPQPGSDLYSLGVVLFKLVSGLLPVPGESSRELIEAHRGGARRSLRDLRPAIAAELVAVIEHALEGDPAIRFRSAGEMERALTGVLERQRVPSPQRPPANPWRRTRPAMLVALGLLLTVAATLAIRHRTPRPSDQDAPAGQGLAAGADPGETSAQCLRTESQTAGESPRKAPSVPLQLEAELYRGGDGGGPLASGSSVAPGDQIYLEVEASEEVHLYILNEDRAGGLFVLFPLPGLDTTNPLPPGRHRLPGRQRGVSQDWKVTSEGGTETFLVVGSRVPQGEFERELAVIRAATDGSGPHGSDAESQELLRGLGALANSASPSPETAAPLEVYESMLAREEHAGDVWVHRFHLLNPVRRP